MFNKMVVIFVVHGLVQLIGLGAFLTGFFMDVGWLTMLGGSLVVLDDVVPIALGVLNPGFPVVLAVVLALFLTPWYMGVFWASAGCMVLEVPTAFIKVVAPKRFALMGMSGATS